MTAPPDTPPPGTLSRPRKPHASWVNFAIDFGPLLAFFIAFKLTGVFVATAVFMVAIVMAIATALIVIGRVSQMLWLSAILVLGFGGLTLYLHDATFIQVKPTVIYAGLGGLLLGGVLLGKPLLKPLLGYAFPGLQEDAVRLWVMANKDAMFDEYAAVCVEEWKARSRDTTPLQIYLKGAAKTKLTPSM